MDVDTPEQLRKFFHWLNAKHGLPSETTYSGTIYPKEKPDEVWHVVKLEGEWIYSAAAEHVNAHHAIQSPVYHGTSPNSAVKILLTGGVKNGKVHGECSHTPWCCMGNESFDKASQSSFGARGCLVFLAVYGERNAYKKSKQKALES